MTSPIEEIIGRVEELASGGIETTANVSHVELADLLGALLDHLRSLQAERDEARKPAETEKDACRWASVADAAESKVKELEAESERIAETERHWRMRVEQAEERAVATESKLSLLIARLGASEKVCEAARVFAKGFEPGRPFWGGDAQLQHSLEDHRALAEALEEWYKLP